MTDILRKGNQGLEEFFASFEKLNFQAGEVLLSSVDAPRGVFHLLSGTVKLYTYSEDGSTTDFHLYGPGSIFPLELIFDGGANRFDYECLTDAVVNVAPVGLVKAHLKTCPQSLLPLVNRLTEDVEALLGRLECKMAKKVYSQVIYALFYFAKYFGTSRGKSVTIKLPLTHQALADWVGCTRETVSVQMEKLRRKGLISYKGSQVTILETEKMQKEALSCLFWLITGALTSVVAVPIMSAVSQFG